MEYRQEGQLVYIALQDGEDLFDSLMTLQKREKLAGGVILSGIGMLRDLELAYLTSEGTYLRHTHPGPLEILSLNGSLNWRQPEKTPLIHLHAVLSDQDNKVVGGHLFGGTICVLGEVSLIPTTTFGMERTKDPDTNWWLQQLVDVPQDE